MIDFTGAACHDADPEIFFPAREQTWAAYRVARSYCDACGLRAECRELVMRYEVGKPLSRRHGLWAGLLPQERVDLEAKRRKGGMPVFVEMVRIGAACTSAPNP